jgi:ribonuclease P protein component
MQRELLGARNASAVDSRVSDTPQGRFPKSSHLLKHSDFQKVYQQGHRHFSGNMTVFYLPAEEMPREARSVRIGLTVPRSLGGAVERNRMRRRTREAVRHNLALLKGMPGGVDVVINPKKSLLAAEFAEISREIERAFKVVRRACESGTRSVSRGNSNSKRPATSTRREAPPR